MKPTVCKKHSARGSVLLITLGIASLFGLFLFYYLNLARGQRTLVARSQGWNLALSYAEAGAEEVLAHLNPGAPQTNINRAANGWGTASLGVYGPVHRAFSAGAYSVSFTDDRFPVIFSTGTVQIAAIPATLTRVLRITTTNSPLFNAAMAAKYGIDFSGNGIATDSFDSGNPNLPDGRYNAAFASTNGDVASFAGVVGVGGGNVNGSVLLGPTATDTISRNGVVSGGVYNDFNFEFEDVVLPQASWFPAAQNSRTIDGVTYQYVFDASTSGDWVVVGLSGGIYVNSNAVVRLKIMNDATVTGIKVIGSGASAGRLTMYMMGSSFNFSGSTGVDGGYAANLSYYGTTNNTHISMSGNASFTGTIYAPQANFSLSGGGSSTYDFVGSVVARTITMNGHFQFHYDEALRRAGPMRPYVANSWREL